MPCELGGPIGLLLVLAPEDVEFADITKASGITFAHVSAPANKLIPASIFIEAADALIGASVPGKAGQ